MRSRCLVKGCEMPDVTRKTCEDFEAVIYGVCWQCGEKLKEIIGYEKMVAFTSVLEIIEKELA